MRIAAPPAALIAAVLLSAAPAAAQGAGPGLQVAPCTVAGTAARCGTLQVWENRAARSGRRIPIHFMVVPATGPSPTRDPVVPIGGGPGQATTEMAGFIVPQLAGVRESRDILMVDVRGTGRSNRLQCPLYGAPDQAERFTGAFYPAADVRACVPALREKADLALYTTDHAADDIDEVRAALGYERLNLFGTSYGTRTALVYTRRHPESVRAAVLMGVVHTDVRMPLTLARDTERSLEQVLAACAAEAPCAAAFPDLGRKVREVAERLERAPARVRIANPRTGETQVVTLSRDLFAEGVRYLLYGPGNTQRLPAVVHQAWEGDLAPLAEFTVSQRMNAISSASTGVYLAVTCPEDVAAVDPAEAARLAEGTLAGASRVRDQRAACAEWPRAETAPGFRDPVRSDAPVLLLSGEWDPATPAGQAREAARTLPNSVHVVVPEGGHSYAGLIGAECVDRIIAGFVRAGSAAGLDTACVRSIRRPPFRTRRVDARVAAPTGEEPARFAGRYRGAGGPEFVVAEEGGRLRLTIGPGFPLPLVPVEPGRFRIPPIPDGYLTFAPDGGASFEHPGGVQRLERLP